MNASVQIIAALDKKMSGLFDVLFSLSLLQMKIIVALRMNS